MAPLLGVSTRFVGRLLVDIGWMPRYLRFLGLRSAAEQALDGGNSGRAVQLARELLAAADGYASDWYYGNAVHHAHIVLGRAALRAGDRPTARTELIEAGRTPGSPQLDTFGPNMRLARELVDLDERDIVLAYMDLCRVFWQSGQDRLARWSADIALGRTPDFGPNLDY